VISLEGHYKVLVTSKSPTNFHRMRSFGCHEPIESFQFRRDFT
jgi:hypothetical protein